MNRTWKSRILFVVITSLTLCFGVFAQSPGKIEISKMNPAGLLVDKYSYMSQPYSFHYFHHMDELGFRTDWIRRGESVYPLSDPAKDFTLRYDFHGGHYSLEDYFERNFVIGFLVLHDNHIAVERYFHGADRNSRFVSQSVSKSIISILIGAAVRNGTIKSIDGRVTEYLPYLSDSGYRDVTVKNLLQMSTGVDYSEDYKDPKSGAALIGAALLPEHRERVLFPRNLGAYAGERVINAGLVEEYLERVHLGFRPKRTEVEAALVFVQVALQGGPLTSADAIELMLKSIDHLVPALLNRCWTLEIARKPRLLTSDKRRMSGMGAITEDMRRVVREQRLGFHATMDEDGTPSLSPKGTTGVWNDDHLFFVHVRSPRTVAKTVHVVAHAAPTIQLTRLARGKPLVLRQRPDGAACATSLRAFLPAS